MDDTLKYITYLIVGFLLLVFGIGWAVRGNELLSNRFFAPKEEEVRRETFEASKAYQSGIAQEIQAMQFEYETASPEHKEALASIIKRRAVGATLPHDLQAFVNSL